MSENVEIVRRWLVAMSAGAEDWQAAISEVVDADIDYYPVRKFPEAQPRHGREEFSQFVARYLEAFPRPEWAIQDLIGIGDDRVLACANMRAQGRGSGMQLEGDIYVCVWLRHGRFFRIEDHLTLRGALLALGLDGESLEAVGLSEQDVHAES